MSLPVSVGRIGGQAVERFGRSAVLFSGLDHPPSLLNHVHELKTGQHTLGGVVRFAPSPGPCHPPHSLVILFDEMVHIFDLPDDEDRAVLDMIGPKSRGIGLTAVNCDLFRPAVAADRLGEEALGRRFVPVYHEENIDGLPARLHGTIAIISVALGRGSMLRPCAS
jgi:hypothetical protein